MSPTQMSVSCPFAVPASVAGTLVFTTCPQGSRARSGTFSVSASQSVPNVPASHTGTLPRPTCPRVPHYVVGARVRAPV